ncbi:MAG: hypothetical protein AVDCRST_MAG70-47 [uncultured Thermomicrobiales bacterium]|uniref:MalT-like TPR region domain-containing protein n=1 Tax=uncultured Thermomicrobiales bacterium TaxID=1645740 RepID=A0A6J4U4B2_9BACT|nr:MAG: hypothetical protein AVDCRST_MAG70-47 [uncultured Thermomicrobiales bacterium]
MSGLWTRLGGRDRQAGANVLIQFAREVVGRRRSLAAALAEIRHASILDALSDTDFKTLDTLAADRARSDREFAQTLARLSHAAAHAKGFDRQMVDAALRLDTLLPADDPSRERDTLLRDAYTAAQRASYMRGGRVALGRLGRRAYEMGEDERARLLLQQQLDLAPESSDSIAEVDSALALAEVLRRDGDLAGSRAMYRRAGQSAQRLEYYHGLAEALVRQIELMPGSSPDTRLALQRQAQSAAQRTGDTALESEIALDVSRTLAELGRWRDAAEELEGGLLLARETGDLSRESRYVAMLIDAQRQLGRTSTLVGLERHMLQLEERLGNRAGAARYAVDLGTSELSLGRVEAARDAFERALSLATGIEDRDAQQRALGGLGAVATAARRPTEALDYLTRALDLAQDAGQERAEAQWLGSIGQALWTFGQEVDAARATQQAVDLARSLGDEPLEASLLPLMGEIYAGRRDTSRARDSLVRATELNRRLGHHADHIAALTTLGQMAIDNGQPSQATQVFEQALAVANAAGDQAAAIRLYRRLARLAQRRGDHQVGLDLLTRALSLANAQEDPRIRNTVLQHLAAAQDLAGSNDAAETYREAIDEAADIHDRYGETVMRLNLGLLLATTDPHAYRHEGIPNLQRAAVLAADLGSAGDVLRERIMAALTAYGGSTASHHGTPPPARGASRGTVSEDHPGRSDRPAALKGRRTWSDQRGAVASSSSGEGWDDEEDGQNDSGDSVDDDDEWDHRGGAGTAARDEDYDVGEDEVFNETTLPPH